MAEENTDEQAPEQFSVLFETSAGNFKVAVTRAWAPHGADHFHALVTSGYYNEQRFFRVWRCQNVTQSGAKSECGAERQVRSHNDQ